MATKAIKFSNDTTTYLPVTDATLVQMKVDNVVKSVQEVILEDEEVTAAGYNELNNRVTVLENADMGDYITQAELDSTLTSYTKFSDMHTLTTAGTKSTNNVVSDVVLTKSGTTYTLTMTYTTALTNLNGQSKDFGKVQTLTDETGTGAGTTTKGTMNADAIKDVLQVKGGNKWITTGVSNTSAETTSDNDILTINHSQIGAVTPITSANTVTASASGATAAWSIDVVKGVTVTYDNAGHITGLSVTSGKIPGNPNTDTNDKVKYYSSNTDSSFPVLFSYTVTPTNNTTNFISYDSVPASGVRYNPNKNLLIASNITADGGSTSLKREDENVITTLNGLTPDNIVVAQSSYKSKTTGHSISTETLLTSSSTNTTLPTSKAVYDTITSQLTSVLKYKGTLGTGGTITSLPAATASHLGNVYVVKTAGNYANVDVDINSTNEPTSGNNAYMSHLEPGDYVIGSWNGSAYIWSSVNGENQVSNPETTIEVPYTTTASSAFTIATVDGTAITLKSKHAQVSYTNPNLTALQLTNGGDLQ